MYDLKGDYNKALKYLLKCLKIQEAVFGVYHISTAITNGNIGLVYDYKGDYNTALEYLLKSLKINEAALGG